MSQKPLRIGLLGLGTVGRGVAQVLLESSEKLGLRAGRPVVFSKAAVRNLEKDRGLDLSGVILTENAQELVIDPDIDLIVEVIGGVDPAHGLIQKALENGKHVVTSNKEVIAKHGDTFVKAAKANGVNLYFEAAVGGGIPIIHGLKNCLSANDIDHVSGILNGTTNFILSKMYEEGAEFEAVLKEAQELGYAEPDPTGDVDGYDVAYKLTILAGIAFNCRFRYEDIYFEGIRSITARDIEIAHNLGYVIKMVALGIDLGEQVELRVHPAMIEKGHPLASVNASFNAVFAHGNYVGETMFYGPGAGPLPTASAIVGDIMDIAMSNDSGKMHPSVDTAFNKKLVKPMNEVMTEYCLRLKVKDEAGVLAKIAQICGEHGVSIRTVHQYEPKDGEAEIVIITHTVQEKAMQDALQEMCNLDHVVNRETLIRVGI